MVEIKILGKGCPKCKRLERMAREAASELEIEATFTKVKAMNEIIGYGATMTPGLVINEDLKCSGRMPSKEELRDWLKDKD